MFVNESLCQNQSHTVVCSVICLAFAFVLFCFCFAWQQFWAWSCDLATDIWLFLWPGNKHMLVFLSANNRLMLAVLTWQPTRVCSCTLTTASRLFSDLTRDTCLFLSPDNRITLVFRPDNRHVLVLVTRQPPHTCCSDLTTDMCLFFSPDNRLTLAVLTWQQRCICSCHLTTVSRLLFRPDNRHLFVLVTWQPDLTTDMCCCCKSSCPVQMRGRLSFLPSSWPMILDQVPPGSDYHSFFCSPIPIFLQEQKHVF